MTRIGMVPLELGMPFDLHISTPERHNLYNTHNFHDAGRKGSNTIAYIYSHKEGIGTGK